MTLVDCMWYDPCTGPLSISCGITLYWYQRLDIAFVFIAALAAVFYSTYHEIIETLLQKGADLKRTFRTLNFDVILVKNAQRIYNSFNSI